MYLPLCIAAELVNTVVLGIGNIGENVLRSQHSLICGSSIHSLSNHEFLTLNNPHASLRFAHHHPFPLAPANNRPSKHPPRCRSPSSNPRNIPATPPNSSNSSNSSLPNPRATPNPLRHHPHRRHPLSPPSQQTPPENLHHSSSMAYDTDDIV